MKRIRRNAHKKIAAIFANGVSGEKRCLDNGFTPEPVSMEIVQSAYEQFDNNVLYENRDGSFTVHIHSNLWYNFTS